MVINTVKKAISRSTFFVLFPQTEVKVVTLKRVSRATRCVQRVCYAGNFIGTVLIGSFIVISDSVDATVTLRSFWRFHGYVTRLIYLTKKCSHAVVFSWCKKGTVFSIPKESCFHRDWFWNCWNKHGSLSTKDSSWNWASMNRLEPHLFGKYWTALSRVILYAFYSEELRL